MPSAAIRSGSATVHPVHPVDEDGRPRNFGMALEYGRPVAEVIGDRIYLTMVVSVAAIIFTWCAALPIGVYSAVRQYSFGDYVPPSSASSAWPSQLHAGPDPDVLRLHVVQRQHRGPLLGRVRRGLLVARQALDLTKHLPLPAVILGLAGTAQLIRIMRANLLDELGKPYVVTARARGLSEARLIIKYPVRVALNPFASTIGYLLPYVVPEASCLAGPEPAHGGAAPAQVSGGPGHVSGRDHRPAAGRHDGHRTFLSDLLLMWIDPRIRFEGKQ